MFFGRNLEVKVHIPALAELNPQLTLAPVIPDCSDTRRIHLDPLHPLSLTATRVYETTSSGTLYLQGIINVGGAWTYQQGTVNAGTSTVVFDAAENYPYWWQEYLNGNMTFNNLEILGDSWNCAGVGAITISTTTTPVVNGNLIMAETTNGIGMPTLNGGTIQVTGNIQALPVPYSMARGPGGGGTATIAVVGTSTQSFTDGLGYYWPLPNFIINKPEQAFATYYNASENVTEQGASALLGYGNFYLASTTIQQGEFWIPSSTIATSTSLNFGNLGNMTIGSAGALRIFQPSTTVQAANGAYMITDNGLFQVDAEPLGCSQSTTVNLFGNSWNLGFSGTGQYLMRYVTAASTTFYHPQTLVNSVDGGNNTGATFTQQQPPPQLIQKTDLFVPHPAGTVTAVTPWGVRPGDTLVVGILGDNGAVAAPADNAGNTYTLVTSTPYSVDGSSYDLYLYYAKNVTGTAPFALTTNFGMVGANVGILDYAGISSSSTLETYSSYALPSNSSSTYVSTGYVNTTYPNDLYVALGGGIDDQNAGGNILPPFATEEQVYPPSYTYSGGILSLRRRNMSRQPCLCNCGPESLPPSVRTYRIIIRRLARLIRILLIRAAPRN